MFLFISSSQPEYKTCLSMFNCFDFIEEEKYGKKRKPPILSCH